MRLPKLYFYQLIRSSSVAGKGGLRRGVLNLGANKIYQLACVFFFHVPKFRFFAARPL